MKQEIIMNEIIELDTEHMTEEQLALYAAKIMEQRQKNIEEQMKSITSEIEKQTIKITEIENGQKKNDEAIQKLKEENNSLGSYKYKKIKTKFMNKAKKRVKYLLGGTTSCDYVVLAPFLHKNIYFDIACELGLDGDWDSIPMDEYTKQGSVFSLAEEIRDGWYPKKSYIINHCLKELIEKRDNGILSPERCRALTSFLAATNNGKDIPFVA